MWRTVAIVARREVQDAVRNRWFQAYTVGFAALSAGVGLLVLLSASYGDPGGFGRAAAGMVNLVLLLAPLMGLTLGAQSLASEREHGTLAYLLAQPVGVVEVFAGKFVGLGLALGGAILVGFAASTLIIGLGGEGHGADAFAVLAGL
ncbi:MAG TPA: ABC transporter permease, partial [Chloroflexota bacterium]|nr:ABC transporter permease [Chloroflexota bacterium]